MAIAVINHADLVKFTDELGFPKYTKVKLAVGGIGHQYYDKYIRDNVRWIGQVDFDPSTHVRITESAQLKGEIPELWALRHQQFLEGEEDTNSLKTIEADVDGEVIKLGTHVNRNAIRITVGMAELKYKVDYALCRDGSVLNENHLAIAVFDKAEDTSLSYTSDLIVDQIWTTQVRVLDDERVMLQKRAYAHNPVEEEAYPWIDVGILTEEEYEIWKQHNLRIEDQVNWANVDFSKIGEVVQSSVRPVDLLRSAGIGTAHLASGDKV